MSGRWLVFGALTAYALVASQHAFYALGFGAAQRALGAAAYVELRNRLDDVLGRTLPWLYGVTLVATVLLLLFPGGAARTSIALALGALLVEAWLMLKRSLPINALFQTWKPDDPPADWQVHRDAWLAVFRRRQLAVAIGFLSLLLGAVWR